MIEHTFTFHRAELATLLRGLTSKIQVRAAALTARLAELDLGKERLLAEHKREASRGSADTGAVGALHTQAQANERERVAIRNQLDKLERSRVRADVFLAEAARAGIFKRFVMPEPDTVWLYGRGEELR